MVVKPVHSLIFPRHFYPNLYPNLKECHFFYTEVFMNISNAGTDVSFTHICIIQVVYLDVLEKVRVSLDLKYYRYTSEIFFLGIGW